MLKENGSVNPTREIYETIKGIVAMMIEKSEPMQIVSGIVKEVDPLLVYYKDKIILDKDILIIPDYIEKSLCIGDALIILKKDGGQRFLVIGKEPYKYSEYQNSENQYSLSVDDKPNQWYNLYKI